MNKSLIALVLPLFLILSSTAFAFSPGEGVVLSFPKIQIQKGERIVAFDLTVATGQVTEISKIPKDWTVNNSAEQSSITTISGGCVHGAGALFSSTELPKVKVIAEKPFDETSSKFSARAKITVTADFGKTREIEVPFEKLVHPSMANATECTQMEAYAAETVTDYLDSWKNVHKSFKEFGHCDDGAIAEGFDEAISLLWANQWHKLPEMLKYAMQDKSFRAFVFKRIGTETVPFERWQKIVRKAQKECPNEGKEFCAATIRKVKVEFSKEDALIKKPNHN